MTKIAWITLRHEPPYRSGSFAEGFERLGYTVRLQHPSFTDVNPGDVVVTWNLNARYRPAAEAALSKGCPLIVAENGYITRKDDPEPFYALARNGHNGSGFWFVHNTDRWGALGHELRPWQHHPHGHILICGQRGIGSELMRSPHNFMDTTKAKLDRILKRHKVWKTTEVRFRFHPGRHKPQRSLSQDMAGARAVVSWSSNVLNMAALEGVPAYRLAPYHVNDAVLTNLETILNPAETDRVPAFHRLAWAQWSLSEIASGDAFATLLQDIPGV